MGIVEEVVGEWGCSVLLGVLLCGEGSDELLVFGFDVDVLSCDAQAVAGDTISANWGRAMQALRTKWTDVYSKEEKKML